MTAMYDRNGRGGDIIYRDVFVGLDTGPPVSIELRGVYKHEVLRGKPIYCAVARLGDRDVVLPETSLRDAKVKALFLAKVDVPELPKVGGRPEQNYSSLNISDIFCALAYINRCLPKRNLNEYSIGLG